MIATFKREKIVLIIIFTLSILLFSTTNKTPNFGWMGTYVVPNFPGLTTGLPFFRPWVIFEKLNFIIFQNLWLAENLFYSIFAATLIFKLYLDAQKNKRIIIFYLLITPLISILFFSAWGGPIYDILFALALIAVLDILVDLNNNTDRFTIIALAFWLSLLDLSRPLGLYFLLMSILWVAFRSSIKRFFLLIGLLFLVVAPFHLIQYAKYETFSLTTYKGQNLAEVFPYSKRNCFKEFGRAGLDSLEFSRCTNQMYLEITNALKEDPQKIVQAFSLNRLSDLLLPMPFWHGTGVKVASGWMLNICYLFYAFISLIYAVALYNFQFNFRYLLGGFCFAFGFLMTIVAHSGVEAIRVFMPFLTVIVWLPLGSSRSTVTSLKKNIN